MGLESQRYRRFEKTAGEVGDCDPRAQRVPLIAGAPKRAVDFEFLRRRPVFVFRIPLP